MAKQASTRKPSTRHNAVTTSTSAPAPAGVKKKRASTKNIFGTNLPSHRLRLPQTGNVTAAEQIIFLTEALRSHDTLNRLLQNRLDTQILTHIINQHRTCPKYPVKNNSVCKLVQNTMRNGGSKDWTVGGHKNGLFSDVKWPADKMTLAGLKLECEKKTTSKRNDLIDNIPFEALAIDVTRLPEGDDALDLTRCLHWILNNPGSGLLWPRDFKWLTEQLGGPQKISRANYDRVVFARCDENLKGHKKALRKAKSDAFKAKNKMEKLKTKCLNLRTTAAFEEAQARLDSLIGAPPALAAVEDNEIVINTECIPPPIPGPEPAVITNYLAQFLPQPTGDAPSPAGESLILDEAGVDMDIDSSVGPQNSEDVIENTFAAPKEYVDTHQIFDPPLPANNGAWSLPAYYDNANAGVAMPPDLIDYSPFFGLAVLGIDPSFGLSMFDFGPSNLTDF